MVKSSPSAHDTGRRDPSARREAWFFGAVVTATDLLPPRIRYGYVHPLTRRFFRKPLAAVEPLGRPAPAETRAPHAPTASPATLAVALLTGSMDVGGIGSVVEVLAAALPSAGVRPVVVCGHDGVRAARLRAGGTPVVVAEDEAQAERALRAFAPDVIELHGAPAHLEDAALATGIPCVPVLHNTEIHYSRARWHRFARVLEASPAAIAVSETVREFHARRVVAESAGRIHVVPNASPSTGAPGDEERRAARAAVGHAIGAPLDDDVLIVSLARYDSQKNVAGLVASFLGAVTADGVRLVIAGEPSDWAELRRADALRRRSDRGDRVALLASSDARVLLAAADGFLLDSFFEGWPVAATEAQAAGLALVLADFGGARELVGRDPETSVVIPNASGPAGSVSDAAVARARRGCAHQRNAAALGAAVDALAARVRAGSRPRPVPPEPLLGAMAEGHADVLRSAVRRTDAVSAGRVEGGSR